MQAKTLRKLLATILVILCFATTFLFSNKLNLAMAGINGGDIVSSSMLTGDTLSIADWKYKENGLSLNNGIIHFDSGYGLNNPLVSRTKCYSSSEIKEALTVSFTVTIEDIKGNKRFGCGYGIERLDGNVDSEGSTFLYFCNMGGGYGVGLSVFESDNEKVLLSPQKISSKTVKVAFAVTNEGMITLSIDGNVLFSGGKNETTIDGFLGFSAIGSRTNAENYVDIYLSDINAFNQYYDKPANVLLSAATFDNNEFNTNEWFLNSRAVAYNSGLIVKDGALCFSGAGYHSNFVNQFAYSNFELQYDIYDVKNEMTYAEDGRPILPSMWQAVYWGLKTQDAQSFAARAEDNNRNMLYFDAGINKNVSDEDFGRRTGNTSLYFKFEGQYKAAGIVLPEKYRFMNEGFEGQVRIRVRVSDGVLTVACKLVGELEYEEIYRFEYPNGLTTTGYVCLGGSSNQFASTYKQFISGSFYTLDNIVICNYDKNPTLVQTLFKTNILTPILDAEYIDPFTDDYLIINTGGKGIKYS